MNSTQYDREEAIERVEAGLVRGLVDERQLIEHREEIAALLERGAYGVALRHAIRAGRRP